MQRTRAKLSVFGIIITVLASCALRFFQLLRFTDSDTGSVTGNTTGTLVLYGLLAVLFLLSLLYCKGLDINVKPFDFENNSKRISVGSALLSVSLFVDFIHRCYIAYTYFESNSYIEYRYIAVLALSGVFALLSCFYYSTFTLTANGSNYDFRNFTMLHFAPILWAFTRLCIIMIELVNVASAVETCVEFIFIVFCISFMFSFASAVDKLDHPASRVLCFTALMTGETAFVLALPRLMMITIGKASMLYNSGFTSVSYIMLGIFSLFLISDINKRNSKES